MTSQDEEVGRGIAIRVGVGAGDLQIDLTAIVPETEAVHLLNPTLDRLVMAGKRQRAIYQLADLEHERELELELLNENQAALVTLDAEFETRAQGRRDRAAELRDQRGNLYEQFVTEWLDSGKRGQFEPRGGQGAQLAKYDQAQKLIEDEQQKANAEYAVARAQRENEIKKRQSNMRQHDYNIAACEGLISGNPFDRDDPTKPGFVASSNALPLGRGVHE